MQQKLAQDFFTTRSWSFWNKIGKEPQKPHPKNKYVYYNIFTENVCSVCNPMQVVVFCKHINFVEKRLKFSHFEDSMFHLLFYRLFHQLYLKELQNHILCFQFTARHKNTYIFNI